LLDTTEHRYSVGDLVRVQGSVSTHAVESLLDRLNHQRLTGVYEIVRLLPELLNGQPQYQIRGFDDEATYVVRDPPPWSGPGVMLME